MDCSLPGSSVHGFSRQEYWSRVPLPSPASRLVASKPDSMKSWGSSDLQKARPPLPPIRRQTERLSRPCRAPLVSYGWDSAGKSLIPALHPLCQPDMGSQRGERGCRGRAVRRPSGETEWIRTHHSCSCQTPGFSALTPQMPEGPCTTSQVPTEKPVFPEDPGRLQTGTPCFSHRQVPEERREGMGKAAALLSRQDLSQKK